MTPFDLVPKDNARIRPLEMPQLRPQYAERARRLARRREAVDIGAGMRVSLVADTGQANWHEAGKPIEVAFTFAGELGYVRTVVPLIQRLLSRADIQLRPDQLDAELAAFIIETVLAETIEQAEALFEGEINLLNLDTLEKRDGFARLAFEIETEPGVVPLPGFIFGSTNLLSTLARHWETQPVHNETSHNLTFTVASRVAFTDLSASALSVLEVGDAMLFDRVAVPGGAAIVVAEAIHASAAFDEAGILHLSEAFLTPERFGLGEFIMADGDDQERLTQTIDDAALSELPIRLVFEVGRSEVTLDELRALGVGSPVPLDRAASSVVNIFANGKRIGAGEMVMIGDQLGVRITRLNSNA